MDTIYNHILLHMSDKIPQRPVVTLTPNDLRAKYAGHNRDKVMEVLSKYKQRTVVIEDARWIGYHDFDFFGREIMAAIREYKQKYTNRRVILKGIDDY